MFNFLRKSCIAFDSLTVGITGFDMYVGIEFRGAPFEEVPKDHFSDGRTDRTLFFKNFLLGLFS